MFRSRAGTPSSASLPPPARTRTWPGRWGAWAGGRRARAWGRVASKRAGALRKAADAEERGDQARGHTWLEVAKLWRGFQTQARIRSIVTLAMGNEAVMRETADFDRDPDMLNAPNGVIDLPSGK